MTCDNAREYPSGVYASSRSCSTSRTSSIFLPARSSAKFATPFPITSVLMALPVSAAICCAATSVSKLVLFHLPWRCSVITRIFIYDLDSSAGRNSLNNTRVEFQFLDQLGGHFRRRTGKKLGLLGFSGHINLFDFLRRLRLYAQRFARDGSNFFFLCGHDALQRGVAHFVNARLNGKHGGQRTFAVLEPPGLQFPCQPHLFFLYFYLHDDGGVRQIKQ